MSAEILPFESPRQEHMQGDKPSLNQGYCKIVNGLVEALAQAPLTSRQFRVVWAIIRKTYGFNKGKDRISGSQLAEETGLVRQRCSVVLGELIRMGIVLREGTSSGYVKLNTRTSEWKIDANQHDHIPARNGCKSNQDEPDMGSGFQDGFSEPKMSSKSEPKMSSHKRQNTSYRNTTYSSSSPSENQPENPERKSRRKKPCPYEAIRDLYNETLPLNPECVVLNEQRKSHLRQRWNGKIKNTYCNDLGFWKRFFEFVAKSKFLTGQAPTQEGRKVFVASLDWLIKPENFAKVIECKYHDEDEIGGEA